MIWLQFPPNIDITRFAETCCQKLDTMADLEQQHVKKYMLMHIVYTFTDSPRAIVHDISDEWLIPLNPVCLFNSYLVDRDFVERLMASRPPIVVSGFK